MSNDLNVAKERLIGKLGPNYGVYIQLLGKWFRGQISKDEFDKNVKQLIEQNFVLEHNKFWLAFFHHCANSASNSIQSHSYLINEPLGKHYGQNSVTSDYSFDQSGPSPDSTSNPPTSINSLGKNIRCLPNQVITHMKIFVIAWEMGLDSANDHVSLYIDLALQHFLKNIITELVCAKTAYRLRENRFKYAIGIKPINPYLNNSLKIYTANMEYDPYQIESNKMNSSLVDTYAYNDSLFPSRLYEAQALYEYACSTTSVVRQPDKGIKRLRLSDIFMNHDRQDDKLNSDSEKDLKEVSELSNPEGEPEDGIVESDSPSNDRKLTLFHLMIAFLSNKMIIPSQSLYSINLERIFSKLSC